MSETNEFFKELKLLAEYVESLRAENESLKAENQRLNEQIILGKAIVPDAEPVE